MNNNADDAKLVEKIQWFTDRCRKSGLKITPQRVAIYKELVQTNEHPSADALYKKIRRIFPTISPDTVNRTLLMLNEIGAAFIVASSGNAKRFDWQLKNHQHFKCVKCKRIVDLHHKALDKINVPADIKNKFDVLRKTIYFEGICDQCK